MSRIPTSFKIKFALLAVCVLSLGALNCSSEETSANQGFEDASGVQDVLATSDASSVDVGGSICHGIPIDDPDHSCSGGPSGESLDGLPNVPDGRYAAQGCSDPELGAEDADGDGIANSDEDKNGNCRRDPGETHWLLSDSDGDGLSDGEEDTNQNGERDEGELDPNNPDSDGDGIPDGRDLDHDDLGQRCVKDEGKCIPSP